MPTLVLVLAFIISLSPFGAETGVKVPIPATSDVVGAAPWAATVAQAKATVPAAKAYARKRLGATQYGCLNQIALYESHWNPLARNRRSGAYGVPQALPAIKLARYGSDWRWNAVTQTKWFISYVNSPRYGSACRAWAHIRSHGWY